MLWARPRVSPAGAASSVGYLLPIAWVHSPPLTRRRRPCVRVCPDTPLPPRPAPQRAAAWSTGHALHPPLPARRITQSPRATRLAADVGPRRASLPSPPPSPSFPPLPPLPLAVLGVSSPALATHLSLISPHPPPLSAPHLGADGASAFAASRRCLLRASRLQQLAVTAASIVSGSVQLSLSEACGDGAGAGVGAPGLAGDQALY